jgi:F-type H+-transporting ATPase subunit delta
MEATKQIKRQAKYLFRLCFVDGALNENRVRSVMQGLLSSKRRSSLPLAGQLQRLIRLNQLKHTAEVQSAVPLPEALRQDLLTGLVQKYGPDIRTSFTEDQTLIGGMRIRVGSDVYDGSIKAGLAALENAF